MISVLVLAMAATCLADDGERALFEPTSIESLTLQNSEVAIVEHEGGRALRMSFDGAKTYPGVVILAPGGAWDLSAHGKVSVDVVNTSDARMAIGMNVQNEGPWQKEPHSSNILRLNPGEAGTLEVTLGEKYGKPYKAFDAARVIGVQIFAGNPKTPGSVVLSNLRAHSEPPKPQPRPTYAPPPGPHPDKLPLIPMDSSIEELIPHTGGVTYEIVDDGDRKALRITTPAGRDWPGLTIKAPGGAWNLAYYDYISLDFRNVDTKDIEIYLRVDNPGADGRNNCIVERTYVQPGQRVTLHVPIKRVSGSSIELFGMLGYPQGLYPDGVGLDPTQIVAIIPFTGKASRTTSTFEVSNVYAGGVYKEPAWLDMSADEFFPMADRYGQFVHATWPGKITSDADLQRHRETEARQLANDAGPAVWNRWGGWANGPTLEATGHFRTAKHEGKWWLVDPEGKLFFSTGLCVVHFDWGATPIEDRRHYFAELPAEDDPMAAFYGKTYRQWSGHYAGRAPQTYSYSEANLLRKYGPDWKSTYSELIHDRLRAWGINTIGNWSHGDVVRMSRTPYTLTFYYDGVPKLDPRNAGFPDVLDPKFAPAVRAGAQRWLKGTTDDPYCIGYFVDNEMPWGGETHLARVTLRNNGQKAAKREFTSWLRDRYGDIAALNRAWGVDLASWEDFTEQTKLDPATDAATRDLAAFTELIAETYFRTVRDAIREIAPNKLYLGCRSVGNAMSIARPAAQYCDVLSYNVYAHSVRDLELPGGLDAPVIIGEFQFAGLDRGHFWGGLMPVDDQETRARMYKQYVRSALDNPLIVGVHWFQYGDEPATGRGDGENAQIGFVDIADTPYPETIAAAREMGETMYPLRSGD